MHLRTILTIFLAALLMSGGVSSAQQTAPQVPGEPAEGLQLVISRLETQPAHTPGLKFRVELRNTAQSDLTINLGLMLANGKRQYANAIFFTLTDSRGKPWRLDFRGSGVIAGREDPFIVHLPAGATFSFPVDLDNYWVAASQEFAFKLPAGAYSLAAQFTGKAVTPQETSPDEKGIALMSYWQGTVTSNSVRCEIPGH
jgi:hypothetical protein